MTTEEKMGQDFVALLNDTKKQFLEMEQEILADPKVADWAEGILQTKVVWKDPEMYITVAVEIRREAPELEEDDE